MKRQIYTIYIILLLCIAALPGCISSPSSSKPKLILMEHPLVGRIWDVKQQAFIDHKAVVNNILESDFLLLGERHDNLIHHQHQAWLIQQLSRSVDDASVAFEMIDNYQAQRIATKQFETADELIAILNKSKTSWRYKQRYKPVFIETIAAGYRIDSANLNSKRLMHTVMHGEDKLPPEFKRMLDKTPMSLQHQNDLQRVINESHCNMLDDKTSKKMVLGQRMRDAIMAHSLLKSQKKTKVLIAGNGHVRNDRAVPLYLRSNLEARNQTGTILAIGFIEVESGMTDIGTYAKQLGSESLPFDIVWFTPAVERKGACDELREHFKKHSK